MRKLRVSMFVVPMFVVRAFSALKRARQTILVLFCLGCSVSSVEPRVQVEQAWTRPGASGDTGAIYLTIVNTRRDADALLSAQCEIAAAVELHRTATEGTSQVATMHQHDRVEIPASSRVEFKPGGLHIMLIGLKRDLRAGERFPVTLRFEKSGAVTVEAEVRQP